MAAPHAQRLIVESAIRLSAQVISPQHTSPVGVAALNAALQERLNPAQCTPERRATTNVALHLPLRYAERTCDTANFFHNSLRSTHGGPMGTEISSKYGRPHSSPTDSWP